MPEFPRPKPSVDPVGNLTHLKTGPFAELAEGRLRPAPDTPQQCVQCELREGLPVIERRVPSYYVSKPGGGLMLILERKTGERLRICGTVDVVVLEVDNEEVELGISHAAHVVLEIDADR